MNDVRSKAADGSCATVYVETGFRKSSKYTLVLKSVRLFVKRACLHTLLTPSAPIMRPEVARFYCAIFKNDLSSVCRLSHFYRLPPPFYHAIRDTQEHTFMYRRPRKQDLILYTFNPTDSSSV